MLEKYSFTESANSEDDEHALLKPPDMVGDQHQLECSISHRCEHIPLLENKTPVGGFLWHFR